MAQYLLKYKGKYRVLPELCLDTGDFPRDYNGNIDEDYDDLYISCQHGNKIKSAHLDESRRMLLFAYIPSIGRGRNIKKAIDEQGIWYEDYEETDAEVTFFFKAKDIEPVAKLMKARTTGANISPFSDKNLPKNSDVKIPTELMNEYKAISSKVDRKDLLIIGRITKSFLADILAKKLKIDYRADMKKLHMSRQTKEYIYTKNMWSEYLKYLDENITEYYST